MRHCPTAHVEEDYEMIYKKGGGVLLFVFKAVVLKIGFYVCTILSERTWIKCWVYWRLGSRRVKDIYSRNCYLFPGWLLTNSTVNCRENYFQFQLPLIPIWKYTLDDVSKLQTTRPFSQPFNSSNLSTFYQSHTVTHQTMCICQKRVLPFII